MAQPADASSQHQAFGLPAGVVPNMLFVRQSLGSLVALLVGIVSSVVLARMLGAEARGEYGLAVKVAGLVIAIAQWGISEVLLQVMGEGRVRREAVVGTTLALVTGGCVVVAAAMLALSPLASSTLLKGVDPLLVWLALAGSVPSILGLLARRFIQLDSRLHVYNLLDSARTVLFLLLAVVLVGLQPAFALGAVLAWAVAEAVFALVSVVYLWARVTRQWSFDRAVGQSLVRAGVPLQLGLLATYVGNEAGPFVLNASFDLASVGIYAVAISVARLVLQLATILRTVLQPRLVLPGTDPAIVSARVTRHGLLGMLVMALALATGSPLMPLVFGAEFAAAPPALVLMLPGMIAYGIMQLLAGFLLRVGHRRTLAISSCVLAVASVGLQGLGARYGGVNGAAFGLSLAYLCASAIVTSAFLRGSALPLREILPAPSDLGVYLQVGRHLAASLRGPGPAGRPVG
jgi:O-antigen/teichoic acid export membrane protein